MDIEALKLMANKLRIHSIKSTTAAGSGHPTSCMSCAEIMSGLFFSEFKTDDEFVLSKGHAAPILWAVYAEAGIVPRSRLLTLRKITSDLEGHPTAHMPYIKVATGSLGQGLSVGLGMALAKKLKRKKSMVYVLLGDGESAEGSVWEAANTAAFYKVDNLCAIIDVNRLGQSRETMHGHKISAYEKKFRAFGWNTKTINGHDMKQVLSALKQARKIKKPFAIIAKTFKGKGVSFLQNLNGWHGKPLKKEDAEKALAEIGPANIKLKSRFKPKKTKYKTFDFKTNSYEPEEMVATRVAFGKALVNAGKKSKDVVVIDGDVGNSTMTNYFMKQFPKRGFQSFIAEQNMTGMAAGFSAMEFIPFMSTFSAFLTRAHDFIRMSIYSKSNIKIVGSHAGVSIGEDGPSQMGLEDISMFLSIPHSIILYPSDAVSAEYCVREMAKHKGISYLRTTRAKTPVIYDNNEKFPVGSLKVLRQSKRDKALVIAAGITVHEALKAFEKLRKKRTRIRVIDLYSIKPVDAKALRRHAEECNNNVVVVEDHYYGGIGTVVSDVLGRIKHLYIKEMPRSGKPAQLMKKYGIDSSAIIRAVKRK